VRRSDKMDRKITVVMPAYHEDEFQIRQAIESILNQTFGDFCYIIVLDDPDNKKLINIIEEYAERDKRIEFYINDENLGCPYSKNRGVKLSNTEYIAIMDADDISRPNRLEIQLNKLEKENLDIVAGYVRVINNSGEPLYNMDNLPLTHDMIVKKMKVNNCMPHPTWLVKKKVYTELEGYADMQGCEDYDFLIRAIQNGFKLGMIDQIVLDYRLSSSSVSRNGLYKQYLMMQYIQDKYYTHKHNYRDYDDIYKKKYSDKRAQKYAKASMLFERAVEKKCKHEYLNMALLLMAVLFSSRDYCLKVLRYVGQNR
jgi:hypothetical protein